ncbi:hypothetical protein MAR_021359 [Mya arenaria]|uniref:Uncharacterized protein n=1 Tax=Mya arenaria TaxID=6604 RepID=A0ABY7E7H5_MYAAR|nr:uncharacterized protein LOC128236143 [Mya arenaria]WAR05990.1 hypothetical protein MAR_021359 [Mya arenaria]
MAKFVIGFVVLVGFLTLFSVDEVFAVKCYTIPKPECQDLFKKDGVTEMECPMGWMGAFGKYNNGTHGLWRGCSETAGNKYEEKAEVVIIGSVCTCEQERSNSTEGHMRSLVVAASVATILTVLREF